MSAARAPVLPPGRRQRRALLLGSGAALLVAGTTTSGCAPFVPPQTAALLAAPPPGLPPESELEDTPFFPQEAYQCGPAALATVLAASGVTDAPPERLADEVFLPGREGSLQIEMLTGARRHDRVAVLLPPRLEALLEEVSSGRRPAVVLQNLGLSFAPLWHYAVVIGHDLPRGNVRLRSGTTRRDETALRTFEHTWARSGHWAFVTVEPGRLPLTADEAAVTQACIGFERAAAPAQAARAYDAALARWPASLVLALGLGNARFAADDLPGAIAAFEGAARRHDSAAAWNNLAQAQARAGSLEAARASAQQALRRAQASEPQWAAAAQATLDALPATATK